MYELRREVCSEDLDIVSAAYQTIGGPALLLSFIVESIHVDLLLLKLKSLS